MLVFYFEKRLPALQFMYVYIYVWVYMSDSPTRSPAGIHCSVQGLFFNTKLFFTFSACQNSRWKKFLYWKQKEFVCFVCLFQSVKIVLLWLKLVPFKKKNVGYESHLPWDLCKVCGCMAKCRAHSIFYPIHHFRAIGPQQSRSCLA